MDISHLPALPGVYLMRDAAGAIIYIGKAKDLKARVASYFRKPHGPDAGWKIPNLVALIRRIDYIVSSSEREALITERDLIGRCQPFFNSMWKDSKSYPRLKITMGEDFPRVLLTRRKLRDKALYFGPYPKVEPLKKLLHYLWKRGILNLRRCKWEFSLAKPLARHKIDACIYYHTGQCPAPCAGRISPADYRALARRAADFLKGDYEKLGREFRAAMEKASADLAYEDAAKWRDFLAAVEHMGERVQVSRYEEGFVAEKVARTREVTRLKEALGLPKPPEHIEAFDTSSLFGRHAVAASVCFKAGEPHHAHYRRYRIRFENKGAGSNDFEMMKEALSRRLAGIKRAGEEPPDLFLIDGGRGQLAYAVKALREAGCKTPAAALAKELEEIFVPWKGEPVRLERSDPGLRLLQRMRDEVHRFAVTYHKKLRDRIEE